MCLSNTTNKSFLEYYSNWSVYLKANDEVDLKYIGDVETRYLEAIEYLINKNKDDKEKEGVEHWWDNKLHKIV